MIVGKMIPERSFAIGYRQELCLQLDLKKKGGDKIMLVIMFIRSINYRRSANRERQVKRSISKKRKKTKQDLYQAKCKAEKKRFGNVVGRDDLKYVFKIAKRMVKTHSDIISKQC